MTRAFAIVLACAVLSSVPVLCAAGDNAHSRKDVLAVAARGWNALARAVANDGKLGWVQQVSDRPDAVVETDSQFYGVGAFLLAGSAVAQLKE